MKIDLPRNPERVILNIELPEETKYKIKVGDILTVKMEGSEKKYRVRRRHFKKDKYFLTEL